MSLSWTVGIPIARVDGGKHNKRILRLNTDSTADSDINISNPLDFLTDKRIRDRIKNIKVVDMNRLQRAIVTKREPEDPRLAEIYQEAMKTLSSFAKKEIKLDSGKFVPLPPVNDSSRIYTAGPTGSGKSTFSSSYIKELKKKHKKMDIFIFSKLEKDDVLDTLKPVRIKIDESIIDNPIELKELKNSICVFDDIDSFTSNKLRDAVAKLRSEVLSEGRHHNISAICTNHQLCDYQKTRNLLLECSLVTFFPKSGGAYGITRFLSHYAGLGKNEIKKILNLPSRWVSVYKQFPMYCLYESGCFLLGCPEDNALPSITNISNFSNVPAPKMGVRIKEPKKVIRKKVNKYESSSESPESSDDDYSDYVEEQSNSNDSEQYYDTNNESDYSSSDYDDDYDN